MARRLREATFAANVWPMGYLQPFKKVRRRAFPLGALTISKKRRSRRKQESYTPGLRVPLFPRVRTR